MSRPLRIEFPGAVYHVTSRGDRREPIFLDDADRHALLAVVERGMQRFDAQMLAYCLMGNHYHFVLHTRRANLSLLMRHINGVYTQAHNRRHTLVGHLFQGRFKAILVDRDAYLLSVCRYVELNPVRAALVKHPQDWAWSSYRAHVGLVATPPWLDTDGLHGYLLERSPTTAADRRRAAHRYADLVDAGRSEQLWDSALRQQIYLGDEHFVERMQALAAGDALPSASRTHATQTRRAVHSGDQKAARTASSAAQDRPPHTEIPKAHRNKPLTLVQWLQRCSTREEALYNAYTLSGITMTAIAAELALSVSYVSKLVRQGEAQWNEREDKGQT